MHLARPAQWWTRVRQLLGREPVPPHLARGVRGELAARRFLRNAGLKFLTANYRTPKGEIDIVCRDRDCLVFVEVKTRSSETWTRPAAAVNARKRRLLSLAALHYIRRLENPSIKFRFDIVEVLLEGESECAIRHLPNAFPLASPYRHH